MTVIWTEPARDELRRIPADQTSRIRRAVARLDETHQGDIRKLARGGDPEWRLRVGDWRVRFQFRQTPDGPAIVVLHVANRRDAYRG